MNENTSNEKPQQSLGEIGHLFLTDLRHRHTGGAPLPKRKSPAVSIDEVPGESEDPQTPPAQLSAVLAHHLGQGALQRVRAYAGHIAAGAQRVGLIEIGEDGLRLTCFDSTHPASAQDPAEAISQPPMEPADERRITQALAEMSWDIRRWILFVAAGPKSVTARSLITKARHWTLLTSADDTGTVTAYRALKALVSSADATISLAVVGADSQSQAEIICRKVAGASKQFLDRVVEDEGMVAPADNITESIALWCRAGANVSEHWTAVTRFVEQCVAPSDSTSAAEDAPDESDELEISAQAAAAPTNANMEMQSPATGPIPMPTMPTMPTMTPAPTASIGLTTPAPAVAGIDEVIDLPSDADAGRILQAVLQGQSDWIASPLKAPHCEFASVAVDRDGRLALLAAAGGGISQLPQISRAYAWLIENRSLVKLALPQMNIDATALPKLTLFIDEADSTSGELTVVLQSGSVSIRTFRRLRWGQKTGLVLERAA